MEKRQITLEKLGVTGSPSDIGGTNGWSMILKMDIKLEAINPLFFDTLSFTYYC